MLRLAKALGILLLSAGSALYATTLEQLSMDDLILKSTGIVHAKVVSSYAALRGTDVYTYYRLEVSETWKGAKVTEVAVPGGVLRGMRQSIAGVPYLASGQDYVLFLWTGKSGLTQVIGMSQGVFNVKADAADTMVTRAASTDPMVDRTGQTVTNPGISQRLSDLRARVRSTIGIQGEER